MIRRVAAVVTAVLCLIAVPFGAGDAQSPPGAPRIGFLSPFPINAQDSRIAAFRQGLRDLGFVEGQNIVIEYRSAEGRRDRLPELAAELVRQKVDVIVTSGPPAPEAAQKATRTVPIVFAVVADPVADGLVASLRRPGGNLTGLTSMSPDLVGKQLELLKAAVPRLSSVVVLSNPANRGHSTLLQYAERAAKTLGVRLTVIEAGSANALDGAFRRIVAERVGGVVVLRDGLFLQYRTRIVDLAANAALPTVFGHREETEAGGLMSYGADSVALFGRAATYVAKILKGEKPADLPVEQPTQFELLINIKTARALGLTIPPSLLLRADRVIE
jgi:putative tryptophan/tyrosine transport system substrate-binding protein